MALTLGPPPLQSKDFDHTWREWLRRWYANSGGTTSGTFSGLDFTGSNITSIVTRNHNDLTTISGGASNDYWHLTSVEHDMLVEVEDSITAGTTQTQAGAYALTKGFNRVTVVGTDGDGVALPTAVAGQEVWIFNADAAQNIQIWPSSGDAINSGAVDAVDTSTLAAAGTRKYVAMNATNWYTI